MPFNTGLPNPHATIASFCASGRAVPIHIGVIGRHVASVRYRCGVMSRDVMKCFGILYRCKSEMQYNSWITCFCIVQQKKNPTQQGCSPTRVSFLDSISDPHLLHTALSHFPKGGIPSSSSIFWCLTGGKADGEQSAKPELMDVTA